MIANILIGAAIFGYAGWALIRHLKKSKEGECGSCNSRSSCSGCSSEIKSSLK